MITFEAKIREQTVKMYADLPLKNAAGAIFKVLMQVSQKTNIFNNKFVLCFGWGFFFLREREDEEGNKFWLVESTDFDKDPLKNRTENVTASLIIQNMQMETVQVAKVQPEAVTMRDTLLVLKEAMNASDVYMSRNDKTKDGDSGWYFGLLDDPNEENHSPDDYVRVPTFYLMKIRSEALRVLQLPVGTVAVFHDNQMTALVDADDQPMKFTTEEERRKLGEKQRAEFEAQVAEAQKRAKAAAAAREKGETPAETQDPDIPEGAIVEEIDSSKE